MAKPAGRKTVSNPQNISVCGVETARCRACGACEEACPFSIPRVVLRRGAAAFAEIDGGACRGCGVCVAACPTGAIRQPGSNRALPEASEGLLVFACSRSGLFLHGKERIPKGVAALELPCAGGVSPAMILGAFARGFGGVLVMGRDQTTCRLNGAEDHVRRLVPCMEELARRVGLGEGRVRFVDPAKGREGPILAIEEARKVLQPTALRETYSAELPLESADDALAVLDWLAARAGVDVNASMLDLLLGEWLAPVELAKIFVGAGAKHGISLSIDAATKRSLDERLAAAAKNGARTLAAKSFADFVQLTIAQRRGAWRATHSKPVAP